MSDQTRNLNPTPEAVFAMFHWEQEYAAQAGGAMDFYDSLTEFNKRLCSDAVKRIYSAYWAHRYVIVED